MTLDELIAYVHECPDDDATQFVLEWIEENTTDDTVRSLVSTLFEARNYDPNEED